MGKTNSGQLTKKGCQSYTYIIAKSATGKLLAKISMELSKPSINRITQQSHVPERVTLADRRSHTGGGALAV